MRAAPRWCSPSTPACTALRRLAAVALLLACAVPGLAAASDEHALSRAEVEAAAAAASATSTFPIVVNDHVLAQLDRLAGTSYGRRHIDAVLARRPAFVGDALAAAGLPPELAAIPIIESGYTNIGAPGVAGPSLEGNDARGVWMFVSGTARSYGLRVDAARDDRLDPAKETHAAVKLLSDLYVEFGDWALAIAAYNQGAQTVRLAIRAEGTRDAWTLIERGALNSYLPKVMAAALLLEDPSLGD